VLYNSTVSSTVSGNSTVGSAVSSTVSSNGTRTTSLCKNILTAIFNDLEAEGVAKWGCIVLSSLSQNHPALQLKLGKASTLMIDIISAYRYNNADMMEECCRAIATLSYRNITNRNRMGASWTSNSEICAELPKIIQSYGEDGNVVDWAVRAIANLAANNPNNQSKLGNFGACEVLVSTLRSSTVSNNVETAKWCAWAIGNMVQMAKSNNNISNSNSEDNITTATASTTVGGISSLRIPPLSVGISPSPGVTSGTGTSNRKQENIVRLFEAGAADVLVLALARFQDHAVVLQWCIRAINNMVWVSIGQTRKYHIIAKFTELRTLESIDSMSVSKDKNLLEWVAIARETFANDWIANYINNINNSSK